jgi:hypothetical protein
VAVVQEILVNQHQLLVKVEVVVGLLVTLMAHLGKAHHSVLEHIL